MACEDQLAGPQEPVLRLEGVLQTPQRLERKVQTTSSIMLIKGRIQDILKIR